MKVLKLKSMCVALLMLYGGAVFAAEETLRPEIGKPMIAAQELIKAGKFKEAMNRIRDAENVPNRTAYESFIIERMRGTAAAGAGDAEMAARAFEAVINSGRLSSADNLRMIEALAGTYYRAKDYAHATVWIQSYFKNGGTNPQLRLLLAQSLFLGGDAAGASREVAAMISADEKAGNVPAENVLMLQGSCQQKAGDTAGYLTTLERLIKYYPKPEYWSDVLGRLQSKPGFSDRLLLDVYRLQYANGNVKEPKDYIEYVQLAIQEGYPGEAKKVVGEGFDKKVLGSGVDAQRHQRLRDLVNRTVAEDRAALDKNKGDGDGNQLVSGGYAYLTLGEADKGLAMMDKGIAKGGLKRPEDAMLHYGMALLQAGNKAKATQAFKMVLRSAGGVGDIARLWMLQAHLE